MKLLNQSTTLRWVAGIAAALLLEWSALAWIEDTLLLNDVFQGTTHYLIGFVLPKVIFWIFMGPVFVFLVDRNPTGKAIAGSAGAIGIYYLVSDFIIRSWHAVDFEGFMLLAAPYFLSFIGYVVSILLFRRERN